MACFSLALSILGLACWLWIRKCMWIFACTSFENDSCDFWKDHTVGGWGVTCKYRCQKNASALKVNYATNDGIARFEKSHTHSRLKRWQREHQSTNYRLHFFVWLKRWITNSFFFVFFTKHPIGVYSRKWRIRSGMGFLIVCVFLQRFCLYMPCILEVVPFHTRTEMLWLGPADRALHPPTYPSQKRSGILFLSTPCTRSAFRLSQSSL